VVFQKNQLACLDHDYRCSVDIFSIYEFCIYIMNILAQIYLFVNRFFEFRLVIFKIVISLDRPVKT